MVITEHALTHTILELHNRTGVGWGLLRSTTQHTPKVGTEKRYTHIATTVWNSICGVSIELGEWYQKTNKTEDTNKLTLLAFKIIVILHNTLLATFMKIMEAVS
jgi:hypothetical protein